MGARKIQIKNIYRRTVNMKKIRQTVIVLLSAAILSGCGESGSKKWRLDNENLTDTEVATLKLTMAMRDKIAKENKWSDLNGIDWVPILVCFPEEREKCDQFKGWNKLSGDNWATLLSEEPRFDDECDDYAGWKMMSSGNWIELLSAQAKFMKEANRNKVFDSFTNENWVSAIKSNSKVLREKCDEIKIWEKLQAKDWLDILSSNSEHIKDANAHNAWKLLKIEDWQVLISKNDAYIKEANSQKILDNLDNATWLNFIAANPKIQSVAEEKEVFKKFTPMEWANLLAKDAKYIELFKKTSSLDKLSDDNLIKLYCTQPNLRNEIFSLNRIDMDLAKSIENLYKHFGDNGEGLSGNKLVILVKIFPELKERINAETFRNYDLDSWVNVLRGDKELYDIMSKKFAYLIPWKKFTFADWVEMLDKNDDLKGMFDRYVNIKELSYPQIRKALFTGSPAFEKYDFWKEFTKEQYLLLIKDDGAAEIGMEAAAELFSGQKIRGLNDLKRASKAIDDFEKNIIGKLVFEGDSKGATEDLKKVADGLSDEKKVYDRNYIIQMAKKHGIFEQFSDENWRSLFEDRELEKISDISGVYYELHKNDADCSKYISEFLTYENIKKYDLWKKITVEQWANLSYDGDNFRIYESKDKSNGKAKETIEVPYGTFNLESRVGKNIAELFNKITQNGIWGNLNKNAQINLLSLTLLFRNNEKGFSTLQIWKNIQKDVWIEFFSNVSCSSSDNELYEVLRCYSPCCDLSKMEVSDMIKIMSSIYNRTKSKKVARMCTYDIKKCINIKDISKDEVFEGIKYDDYFPGLPGIIEYGAKKYCNAVYDFTAEDWIKYYKIAEDKICVKLAFEQAADLSKFSDEDKKKLSDSGFEQSIEKLESQKEREKDNQKNQHQDVKSDNNKPIKGDGSNIPSTKQSDDLKRKILGTGIGNLFRR